ncbi:MAG: hypothetical protein AAF719_12215 [Pseudomonadota bacterium]
MTKTTLALAMLACSTTALMAGAPAIAEEGPLTKAISESKPIFNFRLRYEGVEQDSQPEDAEALTYRIRAGVETGKAYDTSFLVEFDHIDNFVDDYSNPVDPLPGFPVVADPQTTELNRLQLTNTSLPDTTTTLGRQRIILDDSRFVGNVGWRQNEQTFDAIRAVNKSIGNLTIDATYLNQVNRIFGPDAPETGGLAGRFTGDSYLLNVGYQTPFGKLTGFGYWVDVDELGATANSSQTLGFRFAGATDIGPGKADYAVSYAQQSDWASSAVDYDTEYYLVSGGYTVSGFKFGLAYEVLGSDSGFGFRTPLATLHKFQGWADNFLVTPGTGVEDLYATAGYTVGDVGPLKGLRFLAVYHDFSAESTSADYGTEIDLLAAAKWKKLGFTLKYADYSSDGFATDTKKLWFQVDYAF